VTSINDEQKFFDANFITINHFKRSTFDEMSAIVISTFSGVLLNFDVSDAKFALSDEEWEAQPENILAGPPAAIRQRPNPPIPGIPAGPPLVLPVGPLNAADINIANMNLSYHTAAVNRELQANLLCTKYSSILQYIKSALLSRAFAIDQEAYSILIKNRITNLPDRLRIRVHIPYPRLQG